MGGNHGETVASFDDIQENGVFITDLVTEPAGDYLLYLNPSGSYQGEIHVFFVPGIVYSLPEPPV